MDLGTIDRDGHDDAHMLIERLQRHVGIESGVVPLRLQDLQRPLPAVAGFERRKIRFEDWRIRYFFGHRLMPGIGVSVGA